MKFEARIVQDASYFSRDVVRLAVRDDRGATLMADGTWHTFDPGTTSNAVGLLLPSASIEAIAVAVQEWQGHTSHADTEARVLREWLTVERGRVDETLRRAAYRSDR